MPPTTIQPFSRFFFVSASQKEDCHSRKEQKNIEKKKNYPLKTTLSLLSGV